MLLIHVMHDFAVGTIDFSLVGSAIHDWLWQSPADWSLLAQHFDTDVFKGVRTFTSNFYESGQLWALLIGFVIGYILRGLTTYG